MFQSSAAPPALSPVTSPQNNRGSRGGTMATQQQQQLPQRFASPDATKSGQHQVGLVGSYRSLPLLASSPVVLEQQQLQMNQNSPASSSNPLNYPVSSLDRRRRNYDEIQTPAAVSKMIQYGPIKSNGTGAGASAFYSYGGSSSSTSNIKRVGGSSRVIATKTHSGGGSPSKNLVMEHITSEGYHENTSTSTSPSPLAADGTNMTLSPHENYKAATYNLAPGARAAGAAPEVDTSPSFRKPFGRDQVLLSHSEAADRKKLLSMLQQNTNHSGAVTTSTVSSHENTAKAGHQRKRLLEKQMERNGKPNTVKAPPNLNASPRSTRKQGGSSATSSSPNRPRQRLDHALAPLNKDADVGGTRSLHTSTGAVAGAAFAEQLHLQEQVEQKNYYSRRHQGAMSTNGVLAEKELHHQMQKHNSSEQVKSVSPGGPRRFRLPPEVDKQQDDSVRSIDNDGDETSKDHSTKTANRSPKKKNKSPSQQNQNKSSSFTATHAPYVSNVRTRVGANGETLPRWRLRRHNEKQQVRSLVQQDEDDYWDAFLFGTVPRNKRGPELFSAWPSMYCANSLSNEMNMNNLDGAAQNKSPEHHSPGRGDGATNSNHRPSSSNRASPLLYYPNSPLQQVEQALSPLFASAAHQAAPFSTQPGTGTLVEDGVWMPEKLKQCDKHIVPKVVEKLNLTKVENPEQARIVWCQDREDLDKFLQQARVVNARAAKQERERQQASQMVDRLASVVGHAHAAVILGSSAATLRCPPPFYASATTASNAAQNSASSSRPGTSQGGNKLRKNFYVGAAAGDNVGASGAGAPDVVHSTTSSPARPRSRGGSVPYLTSSGIDNFHSGAATTPLGATAACGSPTRMLRPNSGARAGAAGLNGSNSGNHLMRSPSRVSTPASPSKPTSATGTTVATNTIQRGGAAGGSSSSKAAGSSDRHSKATPTGLGLLSQRPQSLSVVTDSNIRNKATIDDVAQLSNYGKSNAEPGPAAPAPKEDADNGNKDDVLSKSSNSSSSSSSSKGSSSPDGDFVVRDVSPDRLDHLRAKLGLKTTNKNIKAVSSRSPSNRKPSLQSEILTSGGKAGGGPGSETNSKNPFCFYQEPPGAASATNPSTPSNKDGINNASINSVSLPPDDKSVSLLFQEGINIVNKGGTATVVPEEEIRKIADVEEEVFPPRNEEGNKTGEKKSADQHEAGGDDAAENKDASSPNTKERKPWMGSNAYRNFYNPTILERDVIYVNRFPQMFHITRKDLLARNLQGLHRMLPDDFNFYPPTYCLSTDRRQLTRYLGFRFSSAANRLLLPPGEKNLEDNGTSSGANGGRGGQNASSGADSNKDGAEYNGGAYDSLGQLQCQGLWFTGLLGGRHAQERARLRLIRREPESPLLAAIQSPLTPLHEPPIFPTSPGKSPGGHRGATSVAAALEVVKEGQPAGSPNGRNGARESAGSNGGKAKGENQNGHDDENQNASDDNEDTSMRPRGKRCTFILKPADGSKGNGIRLVQITADAFRAGTWGDQITKQIQEVVGEGDMTSALQNERRFLLQRYVTAPATLEHDLKWDARVYVLVTGTRPELKAYLFDEGLARLCTNSYQRPRPHNVKEFGRHLTNFSINWKEDAFHDSGEPHTGSKRSLKCVLQQISKQYGMRVEQLWLPIADVVAKTLLAVAPKLDVANRRMFPRNVRPFQLLGFDVMFHNDLSKCWLLEVNHDPSLSVLTYVDRVIKGKLVAQIFELIGAVDADPEDQVDHWAPGLLRDESEAEYTKMREKDKKKRKRSSLAKMHGLAPGGRLLSGEDSETDWTECEDVTSDNARLQNAPRSGTRGRRNRDHSHSGLLTENFVNFYATANFMHLLPITAEMHGQACHDKAREIYSVAVAHASKWLEFSAEHLYDGEKEGGMAASGTAEHVIAQGESRSPVK
ncbi:unnamed protein product [Amoebophrya sp. A120]|nr:unnamed protein product [Amoebophrya sp. A120]|eukprot:GSA120T00000683001.1